MLVERGKLDKAGAAILGVALVTLRSECMRTTGKDSREQLRLCVAELESISALPPLANIGDLELGVPFVVAPEASWGEFLQPLRDAVTASASPSGVECPLLMGIEGQIARQILSDHRKGIDKRHEFGDVYAAHHQERRNGLWVAGQQGVDVGSTVEPLRSRFRKRAADLQKTSGADALVKAMRLVRGKPDSRFVLQHLHITRVDKRIHRGAGLVVRVAEFLAIEVIAEDSICMNLTFDVMQFRTLSSAAAAAMGE